MDGWTDRQTDGGECITFCANAVKLSYHTQIVHQQKCSAAAKCTTVYIVKVTQDHWKWHYSMGHISMPVSGL